MKYRTHPRTGDKISIVGLGTSYINEATEKDAVEALQYAYESGINYADLATAGVATFSYYGKALESVRKNMFYQVHFGAYYTSGEYAWSLDLDAVKRAIESELSMLKTDYIDYGFIHCLDEQADWETYQRNGVLSYILDLKDQGVVKHIGVSSHTPKVANLILDTGLPETLMFSINPGYDYQKGDEFAIGTGSERADLYARCAREGVGITVMKPFAGGQLLDAKQSPFGAALTPFQCLQYALDKPAVLTVLPGMTCKEDVERLVRFTEAPEEETEYSILGSFTPKDMTGRCVYCNHCQPCPAGLDIGLINKYYDLAKGGDAMAAQHYNELSLHAEDCIACGHCNSRCPFKVDQVGRMKEITNHFA